MPKLTYLGHLRSDAWWIANSERERRRFEFYRRAKHFRGMKPRKRHA